LDVREPLTADLSALAVGIEISLPADMPSVAAAVAMPMAPNSVVLDIPIEHGTADIDVNGLLASLSVPATHEAPPFADLATIQPAVDIAMLAGSIIQPFDPGMAPDAVATT
jgi:hypothetical protein